MPLLPHPPRRDPRILLVDATRAPIAYAALDAWEVRGIGELDRHAPSRGLERLLLQVRPSHVVVVGRGDRQPLQGLGRGLRVAAGHGLRVIHLQNSDLRGLMRLAPSVRDLTCDFPEVRHLLAATGNNGALIRTLRLAIAVLFHQPLPPRSYASPRLSPRSPSRVAR